MEQTIEQLNGEDLGLLERQRVWLMGHFESPEDYRTVQAKLQLIDTVLLNEGVNRDETAELQALGIAFGDALEQELSELHWVAVEDEYGRDPALRWLDTSVLVFPRTAISKRIEDNEEIDVYDMFEGFKDAIGQALDE